MTITYGGVYGDIAFYTINKSEDTARDALKFALDLATDITRFRALYALLFLAPTPFWQAAFGELIKRSPFFANNIVPSIQNVMKFSHDHLLREHDYLRPIIRKTYDFIDNLKKDSHTLSGKLSPVDVSANARQPA